MVGEFSSISREEIERLQELLGISKWLTYGEYWDLLHKVKEKYHFKDSSESEFYLVLKALKTEGLVQ